MSQSLSNEKTQEEVKKLLKKCTVFCTLDICHRVKDKVLGLIATIQARDEEINKLKKQLSKREAMLAGSLQRD